MAEPPPPTGNADPVFQSSTLKLKTAKKDWAYSKSIAGSADDADGDTLTYSIISGPAWLSMDADGNVSGTPSRSDKGVNYWEIKVQDGQGGEDTARLKIKVR